MRQLKIVTPAVLLLILFVGFAEAQSTKPRKPAARKPAATKSIVPPLEVRAAREKVTIQRDNVTIFIDVLGPIAQGIETLDESARTRRLSQKAAERNEANKQKVVEAIRNLNAGLANLEAEFRVKISLQKYLPMIRGITDLGAESEDSALAGKFVASKEPLRDIAQKLTDTLAALPR